MNFQELLSRLNTLDQQPVQESDKAKKDYDGDGEIESGKDEYYGSRMKAAFPKDKAKEKEVDESFIEGCGMDMPGSMMGMRTPPQQDSVSMNLSMNGAGANGIRDLMDILRNLDGDESGQMDLEMPDMDHGHGGMDSEMPMIMKAMGGSQDDEEKRMPLGDEMYYGIDAVTQGGGDLNRPKDAYAAAQPGDNAMAVRIAEQLKGLYEEIKLREAYNPNSVDAEHRRGLEKSHEDSLKKKAAAGDESAKKRLQALKDKKERMANDYNDRMER
jgi:hypothetical protein